MASDRSYVGFVCECLHGFEVRYIKMFGNYCVYVKDKPIFLICDDVVYIKKFPEFAGLMSNAECGYPFDGAREHYILDVENRELAEEVVPLLYELTPIPKPKKPKKAKAR